MLVVVLERLELVEVLFFLEELETTGTRFTLRRGELFLGMESGVGALLERVKESMLLSVKLLRLDEADSAASLAVPAPTKGETLKG